MQLIRRSKYKLSEEKKVPVNIQVLLCAKSQFKKKIVSKKTIFFKIYTSKVENILSYEA